MTTQTGDVGGDVIDGTLGDNAHAVSIGKENRQQVINLDARREREGDAYRYSAQDLGRIEHKIDRALDRLDDLARRVQQVEIAIQIDKTAPSRVATSGERILMFVVVAAALLALAVNIYIQAVR